jgi:hypothetical protein
LSVLLWVCSAVASINLVSAAETPVPVGVWRRRLAT